MNVKKENAYKSIGEVAKLLNLVSQKTGKLNTHTIWFWEKEFRQISPKIFSGKRRYYDNKTIEILKKIKFLLKERGMTINGVKKYLINKNSFDLDEFSNTSINSKNNNLKLQIVKISKLVKEIKKLE